MRKVLSLLPLLLTVFLGIYQYIDPVVWPYLQAHTLVVQILAAAFVVSEALGQTELIKANSVGQVLDNSLAAVLKLILRK